jgi:hypothetical protein
VAAFGLSVTASGCAADVGVPPGADSATGVDVNAGGLAAVTAMTAVDGPNGTQIVESAWVLGADDSWTAIPDLDADPTTGARPAAINDAGTVVGMTPAGGFRWDAEHGTRTFGAPPEGASPFAPYGINSAGQVVGSGGYNIDGVHPMLWDPATSAFTVLAKPEGQGSAVAVDINDAGVIAGWSAGQRNDWDVKATVWRPPAYEPELLDASQAGYMKAVAIDEDGTIVGATAQGRFAADPPIGLRWSPAGVEEVLDGFVPVDIDEGTMVGRAQGCCGSWALVWPAGAAEPEPLGSVEGRATQVEAIAGDEMIGGVAPGHVARFAENPG